MQGFLNLNKPSGLTSHDCVARLRRILGTKKIGHGGTLDPAASGVLPIAVGRATRLLPYLASDKAYRAVIRFGVTTTTDDLEGEILRQEPAPQLTLEDIQAVLPQFQGEIEQIPPSYSAIQVGGQRLYDLARRGQAVVPPPRRVWVKEIRILDWQPGEWPELTVAIACGPGTYIRSLARDLGQCLGTGATLATLLRTRSNGFDLADSVTLEALQQTAGTAPPPLIPPHQVLTHLPSLSLSPEDARRWCQGQHPRCSPAALAIHPNPAQEYRIMADQEFLGIGQLQAVAPTEEEELEPEATETPSAWKVVPRMVFTPLG